MKIFYKRWAFVLSTIFIVIVTLFNLNNIYGPVVMPDEVGYWAAGYYFSGENWAEVMGVSSSYYGWGYGLLLFPICVLPLAAYIKYRLAIVLNAILLVFSFLIIYCIIGRYSEKKSDLTRSLSALVVLFASSSWYYSQTTYCESLLLFVWWSIIFCVMEMIDKDSSVAAIILSIQVSFSYCVHNRMIVIVLWSALFLVGLVGLRKISIKCGCIGCLGLVAGFFGNKILKDIITTNLYLNNSVAQELSGGSKIDNILGKLLEMDYWISLIRNFVGELFYVNTSTILLFLLGLIATVLMIKQRRNDSLHYLAIFIAGSFILLICVSVLSLGGTYIRMDHIVYGRYIDFAVGAVVLSVFFWEEKRATKKHFYILILSYLIITKFLVILCNGINVSKASGYSIPGLYGVWGFDIENPNMLLIPALVSMLIIVSITFFEKIFGKNVALFIVVIYMLGVGINSACKTLYYEQNEYVEDMSSSSDDIILAVGEKEIYYLIDDTAYVSWRRFQFKFFLPFKKIIVKELNEYDEIPIGALVAVVEPHWDNYGEKVTSELSEVYKEDFFGIYRKCYYE